MHDGPPYAHARNHAAVKNELEPPQQHPAPTQAIPSSRRGAGGGGGGEDVGAKGHESMEWKKKPAPSVRVPQTPDNANKDLWAQVCICLFLFWYLFVFISYLSQTLTSAPLIIVHTYLS